MPAPQRRVIAIASALLLSLLTACGAPPGPLATPATSTSGTRQRSAPSATQPRLAGPMDDLVAVAAGRLHVRCNGAGDKTIVLIAGFEDDGDKWGAITPALSGQSRVCSYARFGTGTSVPRSCATSASPWFAHPGLRRRNQSARAHARHTEGN
jgi:hypothetical protein